MPRRHGAASTVARVRVEGCALVLSAFRELRACLSPRREVALDDLAVGAGTHEPLARFVERAEPRVVRGFGAQLFAERPIELAAPARDEAVCDHELRRGRRIVNQCVSGGDGSRERVTCGRGASACNIEAHLRFTCISDGNCEISAAYTFVARA